MSTLRLEQKVEKVQQFFDVEKFLKDEPDISSIARYYRINKWAYKIFHNWQGFVHMGISKNGQFNPEDVLGQPNFVAEYIDKLKARKVLELATGKGASSVYLAKQYPESQFYGIDLPEGQLDVAQKASKNIENFNVTAGDFHDLSQFTDAKFDVIFIIEALCHSHSRRKVISEVARKLRASGVFIIFDGYLTSPRQELTSKELLAVRLTEKGMMVKEFAVYEQLRKVLTEGGIPITKEEDWSEFILPSIQRFERLAETFFEDHQLLGKALLKILPREFTGNALSGYFLNDLVEMDIAKYMVTVAQKI